VASVAGGCKKALSSLTFSAVYTFGAKINTSLFGSDHFLTEKMAKGREEIFEHQKFTLWFYVTKFFGRE
jgi:hypothetical protein